jgi:outer membrane protein assembly factor BamB
VFPTSVAWTVPLDELASGPLATDGERIVVATRDDFLWALDPATGAVVWRVSPRPGVVAAAPGTVVLRQADGIVWSIESPTGSARWKVATRVEGTLPPVLADGAIVVAGEGLAALEAATGRVLWAAADGRTATAPPAVTDGLLLVGEADGTLRCRRLSSGVPVWSHKTAGPLLAPPVVDDRRRILLGTTDGGFLALDLARRGRRLWRWRLGADVEAAAAVFEDRVLVASFEGVLYALSRRTGDMIWRAPLPSRPLSGPILVDSAVLVACQEDEILGFDARTGRRLGNARTSAPLRTPPLLLRGHLVAALRDRSVVALRIPALAPSPGPSPSPGASPVP